MALKITNNTLKSNRYKMMNLYTSSYTYILTYIVPICSYKCLFDWLIVHYNTSGVN